METLPPLPQEFNNLMQVQRTFDFEVEYEGKTYVFTFVVNLDVTFDKETNEIVIECSEETEDNFPGEYN
ncbi:MAG: hypothetical protein ABH828_00395 [archaeon]